ncbi:alkaline phosphatase D family protein [Corynebacterium sp. YSMAA1_1_D6]|uniref:alkaline phosphatase D family protein n=1 Tax=Corynebacterium sp. YSMAA1_1_D6 TaxID=3383589 RepID=UPI0038D03EC5
MRRSFTRRRLLHATGLATATAASLASSAAHAADPSTSSALGMVEPPEGTPPFLHGVASGDPIPDSVVLWTRVSPTPEARPGSGAGPAVTVGWEVATDEAMTQVVQRGSVQASAESDHTVHVDPHGLRPDTVYFYRFTLDGAVSPVGRTKTAPAPDASPDSLTFGVASCANWESGFFTAYSDIARRGRSGQLDYMVFLGDYLYEYAAETHAGFGPVRLHHPAHEIVTLADYRTRYGRYRTDPELQAAHAALPWVAVWDDHEIANNNWSGGAGNHDPATEGPWRERQAAAMRAYFEWMPVRATSPSEAGHLYRSLTFGDLVELTMMDLRTYRDQQVSWNPVAFNAQGRTMLGSEQYDWLLSKIETSQAAWNVLGNSVMFSPLNLVTLQNNATTRQVSSALTSNITGIPVNGDQWDGYSAERRALIDVLQASPANALFLTGDIHTEWAHTISKGGDIVGAELVCASVTAPNINEALHLRQGNSVTRLARQILLAGNPHCRHVDLDNHGYSYVTITREEARMHWLRVEDILRPGSPVREAVALTFRPGSGFVD